MDTNTSPISTAIIIAAGKGTRLGALTATQPKCLIPLLGKPMLGHMIDRLSASGVTRIVVVVEYLAEQVETYARTRSEEIVCVRQSQAVGEKYGTGAAVAAATTVLGSNESALVLYGDSLFSTDTLRALVHASGNVLCASRAASVRGYGEVIVDAKNNFVRIDEKPTDDHAGYINAGLYACTPELLHLAAHVKVSARNEYEFTDAVVDAHSKGAVVNVHLIDSSEWTTVTSIEDIPNTEAYVSR
ncbi:MAG: sugar phosphate nucleotidyltransferase [Candidatus Kerfeldbacteria bacterium]|nr:sugar phosphate nucleotidyltransferase [Candidatus Kerfeldbacteria bacterium]